jgi:hypothetical protein
MNKNQIEHAHRFIRKLREFNGNQVRGHLRSTDCFCAEGLLLNQMIEESPNNYEWFYSEEHMEWIFSVKGEEPRQNYAGFGPISLIKEYLGFYDIPVYVLSSEIRYKHNLSGQLTLVHMNDSMWLTFNQIADAIESYILLHQGAVFASIEPAEKSNF